MCSSQEGGPYHQHRLIELSKREEKLLCICKCKSRSCQFHRRAFRRKTRPVCQCLKSSTHPYCDASTEFPRRKPFHSLRSPGRGARSDSTLKTELPDWRNSS